MSIKEDDINKKLQLVRMILNHVYEILLLFRPLLDKMTKLDEAKKYMDDGTFKKAASLFGKVSNICNEIDNNSLPSNTFLENLGN